jgi:nucleoid DNA-binding protein
MAKPPTTTKKTKPLSKAETLKAIAQAVGEEVSAKHVKQVVEHLVAIAHKELKKTGAFVLHGLAKFTVHKKPARPAREGHQPLHQAEAEVRRQAREQGRTGRGP